MITCQLAHILNGDTKITSTEKRILGYQISLSLTIKCSSIKTLAQFNTCLVNTPVDGTWRGPLYSDVCNITNVLASLLACGPVRKRRHNISHASRCIAKQNGLGKNLIDMFT